jgi:hypothetical protein
MKNFISLLNLINFKPFLYYDLLGFPLILIHNFRSFMLFNYLNIKFNVMFIRFLIIIIISMILFITIYYLIHFYQSKLARNPPV